MPLSASPCTLFPASKSSRKSADRRVPRRFGLRLTSILLKMSPVRNARNSFEFAQT